MLGCLPPEATCSFPTDNHLLKPKLGAECISGVSLQEADPNWALLFLPVRKDPSPSPWEWRWAAWWLELPCEGTETLLDLTRGQLHGASRHTHLQRLAAHPFWEDTCLLPDQPEGEPSKQLLRAAPSRLFGCVCWGVFTHAAVRGCLNRVSGAGLPGPDLTLVGGP